MRHENVSDHRLFDTTKGPIERIIHYAIQSDLAEEPHLVSFATTALTKECEEYFIGFVESGGPPRSSGRRVRSDTFHSKAKIETKGRAFFFDRRPPFSGRRQVLLGKVKISVPISFVRGALDPPQFSKQFGRQTKMDGGEIGGDWKEEGLLRER